MRIRLFANLALSFVDLANPEWFRSKTRLSLGAFMAIVSNCIAKPNHTLAFRISEEMGSNRKIGNGYRFHQQC